VNPTTDPNQIEMLTDRECEALLVDWCAAAGLEPRWPLTADDAVTVLRDGGQYVATVGVLAHLDGLGLFEAPDLWSARDVIRLAAVLEGRRQWRPTPSVHDSKKPTELLNYEQARADGRLGELVNLLTDRGVDLRTSLLLMVAADNRMQRERLLSTVLAFLSDRGVDV
jgi:hypothetical protein